MATFVRELGRVWRRQTRNWRIVVIRQIFNRFFNELTLQYANIYITLLGASPVQVGEVNSAMGFAQALISIPLGVIRDRFNVRKVFLIGVALLALVPLLYAMAPSWQMIFFAIFLSGFVMSCGSCVLICDLSLPNRDRATGRALCEGIGALPTILAPTAAAVLLTLFGGITIQGIRGLYWIQFAARLILLLYVYRNLTDVERPNSSPKGLDVAAEFGEVFRRGTAVKRWILFQSVNTFTMSIFTTFSYLYLFDVKGASQYVIGGFATATLVAEAIFSTIVGRSADKIGRKKTFYILIPVFSAANLALILAHTPGWLLLTGFLVGFRRISQFSYNSMTPELVPPECLGRWRGLIGLFTGLARIPAPVIGGLIWERLGPQWVFIAITVTDLLIRTPLLYSVPETLRSYKE